MEVDDAQAASQEAQAQARQGPAAVPAELNSGSGAQSLSSSTREIESRKFGDVGAFDNPEVSVPKKSRVASFTFACKS